MNNSHNRLYSPPVVVMIATLLVVIGGLTSYLWYRSQTEAYRMLTQEGEHLAESIGEGTLHGLRRVRSAQDALISRLRVLSAWIDTTLSDRIPENGYILDDLTRREKLEGIIILDRNLEPVVSSFSLHGHMMERMRRMAPPHHRRGAERSLFPALRHLMEFKDSSREFEVFNPWKWRHHSTDAVGFAYRRKNGGIIYIRATRDLMEQTLDTESFSGLLRNLTLSSRIVKIALVDTSKTVVLASHPELTGLSWPVSTSENDLERDHIVWIEKPITVAADENGMLCLALSTADIGRQLSVTKRNLAILAFTALIIGLAGVVVTQSMHKRHQDKIQEMEQELDRQERFADIGRMSAGVAHEIRNPLNAVALTVQRILKEVERAKPDTARMRDLSNIIRKEMNRMDTTIRQMGALAHSMDLSLESVDIVSILRQVVDLYDAEAEDRQVTLEYTLPERTIAISGNDPLIRQAIGNVILNAIQATPEDGIIRIALRREDHRVRITVHDQGAGFSKTEMLRADEPFYTTKTRGLGLGFALARRIIDAHGGSIEWRNHDDGGAVVTIELYETVHDG